MVIGNPPREVTGAGRKRERREHARFRVNMRLKYRCVDETRTPLESLFSKGRVVDISEGGMLAEVDGPLDLGQMIEVYATKEEAASGVYGLVVAVRVVRAIDLYEVGMRFILRERT